MSPHEQPIPGPAADFAASLAGQLPMLETPRLRLRAPTLADFPTWAEILGGPAAPWIGGPFTRDEAFTEFTAAVGTWLLRGHGPWAVETHDYDLLGFVLISFEPGDPEPELGFLFTPTAEGHGYAYEAAQAARHHAFHALALPYLVSCADPDNTRSRRLLKRLDATPDGQIDGMLIWRHPREAA